MNKRIRTWNDYWDHQFAKGEDGDFLLRSEKEIIPFMAPKFRRMYDRMQRRMRRKSPTQRIIDGCSRRCVRVVTVKYRARKRRKR